MNKNEKLKKKTIITILGRSASGKTYIAERLSEILGYKQVVSHTTRPMRETEYNGREHWFNTKEEFDDLMANNTVIAYTKIGEYEYCATLEDISDKAIYIIDAKGIEYLKQNFKDKIKLYIVYIYCDEYVREARASIRSDFKTLWHKRNKDEDRQFTEFESNRKWDLLVDNTNNINMDMLSKKIKKGLKNE